MGKKESVSEDTLRKIDEEVKKLINEAHQFATNILNENIDKLHDLGLALLEYETLNGDEIKTILAGGKIDRGSSLTPPTIKKSSFGSGGSTATNDEVVAGEPKPAGA